MLKQWHICRQINHIHNQFFKTVHKQTIYRGQRFSTFQSGQRMLSTTCSFLCCRSLWKHFRAVSLCLFLLVFPSYMAYMICQFFHMDFWLLIIISSSVLTSLQVTHIRPPLIAGGVDMLAFPGCGGIWWPSSPDVCADRSLSTQTVIHCTFSPRSWVPC